MYSGKTTGHPITILIRNKNARSQDYESLKQVIRPSHADFTYKKKYGIYDHRGGGRASARETAARVCAGYFAKKILFAVHIYAYLSKVGTHECIASDEAIKRKERGVIRCPDPSVEKKIMTLLQEIQEEGDSIGGVVTCVIDGVKIGLGEPLYYKLESQLASAMMSIPASRGIEFGCGFKVASMRGSEHNDQISAQEGFITNHSGGILGGISTGERIVFRVAFKPASSIRIQQQTINQEGENCSFTLSKASRHDPCVCIRAIAVVESMAAITLADLSL